MKSLAETKVGMALSYGKIPKIWWFPFIIYTMTEASDFKFGTQLRFAKTHHKIIPGGKVGVVFR